MAAVQSRKRCGDEHSVTIAADTLSNHLLVSQDSIAVVVLHNHPSMQTFSLTDISFFLQYNNVRMMSVVSNYGKVHYLCKDENLIWMRPLFYGENVADTVCHSACLAGKGTAAAALSAACVCGDEAQSLTGTDPKGWDKRRGFVRDLLPRVR